MIENKMLKMSKFDIVKKYFIDDPFLAATEGLPVAVLLELDKSDQKKIEEMLLEKLPKGDLRAVVGLGALKSEQAAPLLRRQLGSWWIKIKPSLAVETCLSLWKIEKDPEVYKPIVKVLKKAFLSTRRSQAARALTFFDDEDTLEALFSSLTDPDASVRSNVVKAILIRLGMDPGTLFKKDELNPLIMRVRSRFNEEQKIVREELNKLKKNLKEKGK